MWWWTRFRVNKGANGSLMPRRWRGQKKVLQVVAHIADQTAAGATALQGQAGQLHHDLQKLMRGFGRQCRGKGNVCVTLVRQTEKSVLEVGQQVLPLALAAQERLRSARQLAETQRARLDTTLTAAIEAHPRLEKHSRRLTTGKALTHAKLVKAYDLPIAPMLQGKSNCPTQCGKNPGMLADMASGFTFALHLPVGNPGDASDVLPVVDKVPHAIARVAAPRQPVLHSVAGDLALNDPSLREALHARGILTVGIPRTIDPLTASPTQEDVHQILHQSGLHSKRTPHQVHLACACGYSRPVVESFMENLLCRGAAHLQYKGHRGAIVHMGMTVVVHNAATLVRIQQNRLSKRAQKLRRLLGLKSRNFSQFNASKN